MPLELWQLGDMPTAMRSPFHAWPPLVQVFFLVANLTLPWLSSMLSSQVLRGTENRSQSYLSVPCKLQAALRPPLTLLCSGLNKQGPQLLLICLLLRLFTIFVALCTYPMPTIAFLSWKWYHLCSAEHTAALSPPYHYPGSPRWRLVSCISQPIKLKEQKK